jgi:S-(hydroxymethyl)glutathione dehydrogenase/alcohol dehydrogenase
MAIQVSGNEVTIAVDLTLFEWDKTYLTPLYGGCRPQFDIPIILDLYATGRLEIDALISATYPLEAVADAFADMAAGRVIKAVIEFPVA